MFLFSVKTELLNVFDITLNSLDAGLAYDKVLIVIIVLCKPQEIANAQIYPAWNSNQRIQRACAHNVRTVSELLFNS
jgi:hypothetical protein